MATHRFVADHWHNVLGTRPPAFTVTSGDTVITETLDAAGWDKDGVQVSRGPNPMNGPIFIETAEPGDALKVEIVRMTPNRATGWTRSSLAANVVDPESVRDLPSREMANWSIDRQGGTLQLSPPVPGLENLVLPLEPMIGCFGVAPALGQAFSTATSAENGGNMDYRGFGPGATVWFPVAATGALFFLGDCHAVQGDGEIVGTGVETSYEVEVRLTVEKGKKLVWPRGENEHEIFSVGNARPLDQALQHATNDMFNWLTSDYGLSKIAASHLLGQVVRYEVGNVYDPAYTMVCKVEKEVAAAPLMADRIALISDLHGNLQALDAVLVDIAGRGITRIFNLGDLVGKGPDGAAVIDRSRAVCEVTVQGNWDAKVAGDGNNEQNIWHRAQIGPERCAWLAALPGSFDFALSGQRVRLFHASNQGIYHRVHLTDSRKTHLGMFENTPFTGDGPVPDIVGYGDVHDAFTLSFSSKTLFNPGSVGNPLDVPLASYAILEGAYGSEAAAPWSINILRVPYDIEAAIRAGYASGMPDADAYAGELRTARYRKLRPLP